MDVLGWISTGATLFLGVAAWRSTTVNDRVARDTMRMAHAQAVTFGHLEDPGYNLWLTATNGGPYTIRDVSFEAIDYEPDGEHASKHEDELKPGEAIAVCVDDSFKHSSMVTTRVRFTYRDGSTWLLDDKPPAELVSEAPPRRWLRRRG